MGDMDSIGIRSKFGMKIDSDLYIHPARFAYVLGAENEDLVCYGGNIEMLRDVRNKDNVKTDGGREAWIDIHGEMSSEVKYLSDGVR